jgi:hypothetical protein
LNLKVKQFIQDVTWDLIENGITVKFEASQAADYKCGKTNIACEGWLNDSELVCATKFPLEYWITTFSHEYCHFKQLKEKSEYYVSNNVIGVFDKFICGKKVPQTKLIKVMDKIRVMEWDCEKRSIVLLKQRKLGFNFERIIQRANAYIFFYSIIFELNSWYHSSPSLIKEIVDVMPTSFLKIEEYKVVTPQLIELYKDLCLQENKETEIFHDMN